MLADGVIVLIQYQAQPHTVARARQELSQLIATVVANEPECRGIRMHQDMDDSTRFLLYEQWTDRASFDGPHMQTAHLQAFMIAARALFTGPPVIGYCRLTDDVTPH